MSGPRLRVAVVGCGIGGPAAALFLARSGHHVTIFERTSELGPRGAGILLAPTGQYVLAKLGLLREVAECGSIVQRLEGQTVHGRKILDVRYHHFATGTHGIGIHRGNLFSILRRAMDREAAIELRTGFEAVGVEGGFLLGRNEGREGPYDLIVCADGARSALRSALGLETGCEPYAYGALWISLENWGAFPDNVLRQSFSGTKRMLGLLPSGRGADGEGREISLFWGIQLSRLAEWRRHGISAWKQEALALLPELEELLAQVESPDQFTIASYLDVRTWSTVKDHCVLIGDAAHASSPQLGQGASLALIDALTLAACVAAEPDTLAALLQYRKMRQRHVAFYQAASRWMTPLFQSEFSILATPRDLLMPVLCRAPWLRKELAATMAGVKSGAFSRLAIAQQMGFLSERTGIPEAALR